MTTSNIVSKPKPIRTGDKFRMPSGSEWEVIRTRPPGIVELFNKVESRFTDRYCREMRDWERL